MAIPAGNHNDWPFPFSLIPRSWTAFASTKKPIRLAGTATGNLDVPGPGTWALAWPPHFAFQTKGGWLFRIGIRYDYVDQYYEFPAFTLKKEN